MGVSGHIRQRIAQISGLAGGAKVQRKVFLVLQGVNVVNIFFIGCERQQIFSLLLQSSYCFSVIFSGDNKVELFGWTVFETDKANLMAVFPDFVG
ncbi:hypothetical protein I5N09_08450 [Serratia marcescens]|uniref:hypothetical protein n=1 Tax=Serratia TaxID=613 RepID=UPI0013791A8F|nr:MULTISPECIES: hypothetical protein [Serratia]MBH3098827.1 hypothetical protein [Serratia marcescens]MBH3218041.1 hypothetical protein [Serratia marcescens]NIA32355.1 hypothetical protein [Serratia marcescens]QIO26638.1 hypothetical protein HAP49_05690 [Serratia marcescens]WGL77869.1 hypothetical protein QFB82_01325 [Serratia marcescens]